MKKQGIQDERVVAQRRKINSEAYGILMLVLLIAIIIQEYFLNAPFEQYAVEVICFFGMSLYIIVRNVMLGLNLYGEQRPVKGIVLLSSLIVGVTTTTINGVLNYMQYAEQHYKDNIGFFIAGLAITFISATGFSFALLSFIQYLNKKRQDNIQQKLDAQEEDE